MHNIQIYAEIRIFVQLPVVLIYTVQLILYNWYQHRLATTHQLSKNGE